MRSTVLGMLLALIALPSLATDVRVDNAWARATAPGQPVAGVFMDLTAAADMILVGARSPASNSVELHTMAMDNGVMIMRQMEKIDLPKDKTVNFKPGGLHIMLIDLKAPLRANDKTRVTLRLTDKGGKPSEIDVEVPVRNAPPGKARH